MKRTALALAAAALLCATATAPVSADREDTRKRPRVQINYVDHIPSPYNVAGLYGVIYSGTGVFLCGAQYCDGATASGPCGPTVHLDCSCLGDVYAELHEGPESGVCTVTFQVHDDSGLSGTSSFSFAVQH